MHGQYPNPLQHFGAIKIAPPVIQSNKLSASEQQQLHEENKKQESLKQQSRQLELDLISLKQSANNFQKIVKCIKDQPNHSYHQQTILEKGQNLTNLIQRSAEISERLIQAKQQRLGIFNQMLSMKVDELTSIALLVNEENKLKSADELVALYEKRILEVKQEVEELEGKINSHIPLPDFSDKITEFTTEIISVYPEQISPIDIELIKRLDFSELTTNLLNQIKSHKTSICQLSKTILHLRQQASLLAQQTSSKDELDFELKQSKLTFERNRAFYEEIKNHNDYLEQNLEFEVENEVRERGNELNELHYKQNKKFLMTSEYLLNGFAGLLPEQQLLDLLDRLNQLKEQAEQKKDHNFLN